MTGFQTIKNMLTTRSNEELKSMYSELSINEDSSVEEMTVIIALQGELENRGLIKCNEETWEYDLI